MIIVPMVIYHSRSDVFDYTHDWSKLNVRDPLDWFMGFVLSLFVGGGSYIIARILLQMYAGWG